MHLGTKQRIIALAEANSAEEICGFIVQTVSGLIVHECRNVTQDPEGRARAFEISPEDYMEAVGRGKVCGIYHSHSCGGSTGFSEADLEISKEMNLPIYLYVVDTKVWLYYVPITYIVPEVGAEFSWGWRDCYETIRIHFRQTREIYLRDYDRDETFEHSACSEIVKHIEEEGFIWLPKGEPIKVDDVLLFKTPGSAYPQHLAVFIGRSMVLHHPRGHLSRTEPLNGNWMKRIEGVLRYVGKPQPIQT